MNPLIKIDRINSTSLAEGTKSPYYYIVAFDGTSAFHVDFTTYQCKGKTILFLSPYQLLQWEEQPSLMMDTIRFHGDFYCIEYHKKEVACNGILFNNIYQQPYVFVNEAIYTEITEIIRKMKLHLSELESHLDISIISTYLQLILALCSKEKQSQMKVEVREESELENITHFQRILEAHFLETKEVAFYARKFGLTVNAFSKKIKKHFGKSPTRLIKERTVLEAKKLLHLTHKSIKEVAADLNFRDEFYFSRYFKKEVGVSPTHFREKVGISIAAQ